MASFTSIAPPPFNAPQSDPQTGTISKEWGDWFNFVLLPAIGGSSQVKAAQTFSGQTAAIGLTRLFTTTTKGLYRVSYYARITTAASVSSSVTVALSWVETALPLSLTAAAITGNTTLTVQSSSILIVSDANANISLQTAYASVGTPMSYRVDTLVEQLSALA